MGATELWSEGKWGALKKAKRATGVPSSEGGGVLTSAYPSSASASSIWPWGATASLRWWPQLQKTVQRTGTEMCCPVSLKLLLTCSQCNFVHALSQPVPCSLSLGHKCPQLTLPCGGPLPPSELPVCLRPSMTSAPGAQSGLGLSESLAFVYTTGAGLFPQMTGASEVPPQGAGV